MAHSEAQKKHIRISEQRRQHNASRRSMMKTAIKKARLSIQAGTNGATQAQESYRKAQVLLDRFASRGLIHKNKAARHKSQLASQLYALKKAAEKKEEGSGL